MIKNIFSIILVILAGALMAAAHPFRYENFSTEPNILSFIVASIGLSIFIPVCLRAERKKHRFLLGLIGGTSYFSATMYWIAYSLQEFGNIHLSIAILAVVLLSAYNASYLAIWSLLCGSETVKDKTPLTKILCWASLWAGVESLRQWLFTGLSWGELGYSFSAFPFIARTTSLWGVHALTFFWIFLIGLLLHSKQILDRSIPRRTLINSFVVVILLGGLSLIFYPKNDGAASMKIAIVQPNVSQDLKWNPNRAQDHLQTLLEMTAEAFVKAADLAIWPETALPYLVGGNQRELPFNSSTPLLLGAVVKDGIINRNSALLTSNDKIVQRFDKVHLVPFGEYVPFKDWLPLGKLVANAGDFLPGSSDQELLSIPNSPVKVGPLICYEDIFSRSSVDLARKGANILINLTNDAWYGPTSAQEQHAEHAAMQVYQTGIPMVRATNNGLSSFISPHTRTDLPGFQKFVGVESVAITAQPSQTFFVWTYPLMEWIFVIIFVTAFVWKSPAPKKRIFFQKSKRF